MKSGAVRAPSFSSDTVQHLGAGIVARSAVADFTYPVLLSLPVRFERLSEDDQMVL